MKMVTLADLVKEMGQRNTALMLGVHQTAISKALRLKRNIFITRHKNGDVEAEEIRPFPAKKCTATGSTER